MALNNDVLEILVDPVTKSKLSLDKDRLVSEGSEWYPLLSGTPYFHDKSTLPEGYQTKGKELFKRTRYRRSWMLNHFEDLGIGKLIGPAAFKGMKMLCLGGGDKNEKDAMRQLGYDPISLEYDPIEGVDVVGDAHYLPFADASFDIVTTWEVFEHLHSPWVAIKEVNRVLKPGGRFVGSVAFIKHWHASYFHMSHWGVHSLLTNHGFELKKIYGGQNFLAHTLGKYLPNKILFSRRLPRFFYNTLYKSARSIKVIYWKLKGRDIHEMKKHDGKTETSLLDYHYLTVSATVLFDSVKVKSV